MKELENTLYVRMLGGFSLRWNGQLVAGGSKASDSQSESLLQILIHGGEDFHVDPVQFQNEIQIFFFHISYLYFHGFDRTSLFFVDNHTPEYSDPQGG